MQIKLEKLSKRYNREWIIRSFSHCFESGNCYGISGRNGAGKSTLLRILSGHLTPSRGRIAFSLSGKNLAPDTLYKHLSFVGPYIDLIEELTLQEAIDFHFQFKPLRKNIDVQSIPHLIELDKFRKLPVKQFSSGMKQRLALGLALFSDTSILLLDEPTVTLDTEGKKWFHHQLESHKEGRLVVLASNIAEDLSQCGQMIDMANVRGVDA